MKYKTPSNLSIYVIQIDGTGKTCIYAENRSFPDENLTLKHDQPGILSMANSGKFVLSCSQSRNGTTFLINKHLYEGGKV